jgi:aspartyl-tRNA(Asn)/glutamyl-tRNA(Gln) amidotransferase subunit C
MSAPAINIHRIAELSRLKLTDAEAEQYSAQLAKILEYVDVLSQHDLNGVEPSAHSRPVFDVWREDIARPGFTQDEALLNAPRRAGDQFMITKVVE